MKKYLGFAQRLGSNGSGEDLCLVVDTSPSMDFQDYKPSRLKGAVKAGLALLEIKQDQYPSDQIAVIGFNSSAKVIHPLVNARDGFTSVKKALHHVSTASCTNIAAGLRKAGELLAADVSEVSTGLLDWVARLFTDETTEDPQHDDRRASRIVLLSDGCANTGPKPAPVAEVLKNQGILIDVVGIGGSQNAKEFNEDELKRIASTNADGTPRYFFIDDTAELIRTFKKLAHHIRPLEK